MPTAPKVFSASDVSRLLDMRSCVGAVENAFRLRGDGRKSGTAMFGLEAGGGTFHAKLAAMELSRSYFVAKINANFPQNPSTRGLPTIQGMLVLFDASSGTPLAAMDSGVITTMRTAAASAVAAKYLALPGASSVGFVGCGVQAAAHLEALRVVRDVRELYAFDTSFSAAERFAAETSRRYGIRAEAVRSLRDATHPAQMIVTSTPSKQAFLGLDDVTPGAFIAAVGADNEHKQEIEPALLAASAVVVDDLDQCSRFGDLHHALEAGLMQKAQVRASLDEIIAGAKRGRREESEIVVFDSTGVAIEDLAAAALVYESAEKTERT